MRIALVFLLCLALLCLAPFTQAGSADYFTPEHRISGIGVARDDISDDLLEVRTDLMIQSQTFGILREAQAVPGAKRITGDAKLQAIFQTAALRSGLPATLIEAIAYLESWGDATAESPSGPRGIMQISGATARGMGLKIVAATRYKVTKEKVQVIGKNKKPKTVTVTRKTPYSVTVRDDRLTPSLAVPAAAVYLAGMEQKFGGRDWAVFAYHCGQGCVAEMQEVTRRAHGIPKNQFTVPRMFFSCNPAWNRELYEAIFQQMQRDYSPTYYFRVMRAQQLLALYRRDPAQFTTLAANFKSDFSGPLRASHRLSVWLKRDDIVFHTGADLRADSGRRLVRALERPAYFGYSLKLEPGVAANLDTFAQASPAAVGTLMYIAFETRRMFQELKPKGEKFQPLEVSSLVEPEDLPRPQTKREGLAHGSGQVFDVNYAGLPPGELECLRFVLEDLGWEGYLGFVEEGTENLHIGCSPSSRDFFATVFQEGVGKQVTE